MVPLCFGCATTNSSVAVTIAASAALHVRGAAPVRDVRRDGGLKGSLFQSSSGPVGTTSVWPAKHSTGPPLPRVAQKLSTLP